MKKHPTALSVRAKRTNRLNYKPLENRQLLAADLTSAAPSQTCDLPASVAKQITEVARKSVVDVTGVTVGDGTDNRSMVESLTVSFNGIVNPEAEAFSVINRETGDSVDLNWTVDNSAGFSNVEIRFSGSQTINDGSLVDGNYELTVRADFLGSDTSGTDFVFGNLEDDDFYRFFGDTNSDRSVDVLELLELRNTWTLSGTDDGFDSRFDHNKDDSVNLFDLLSFRLNYNESLEWVG